MNTSVEALMVILFKKRRWKNRITVNFKNDAGVSVTLLQQLVDIFPLEQNVQPAEEDSVSGCPRLLTCFSSSLLPLKVTERMDRLLCSDDSRRINLTYGIWKKGRNTKRSRLIFLNISLVLSSVLNSFCLFEMGFIWWVTSDAWTTLVKDSIRGTAEFSIK